MSNVIVGNSHRGVSGNRSNNIGTRPSHLSISLSHWCSPMPGKHEGPAPCSPSLMLLLGTMPRWNIWISAVDEFWQVRRWLLIWNRANQRCLQWSFYKQKKTTPARASWQYSFSVSTRHPASRFHCTTEAESRAVEGEKKEDKKTNRNPLSRVLPTICVSSRTWWLWESDLQKHQLKR